MTTSQYRKESIEERRRHNLAVERRNRERDIKRDEERRLQERRYRNNRLFSNAMSAPQSASNILRTLLAYCLIIMLSVNFVRVSNGTFPLTVTSFFETMANAPDVDFSEAMTTIANPNELGVFRALNTLLRYIWHPIVRFAEYIVDCFAFWGYFASYLFGWV